MRKLATYLRAALLVVSAFAAAETPKLKITLKHGNPLEQRAQEQLERIAAQYDLKKYTITRDINIETGVIPHSHPVLTLNARFLDDDDLMLSSYIHEQAHWVLTEHHRQDMRDLYRDLKRLVPDLPIEPPQGDGEERSTYFHQVVIELEWSGTEELIGAERARKVIDWKKDDHYKAIYRAVIDNREKIEAIMRRYHIKW